MSILEQYWSGVLRRLQTEVDTFNRLIAHSATMGSENEVSLARVLERLLPGRYGVGSGLLVDRYGGFSKQMDIIVYDRADEPALMAQTNQVLFPVENVRFCIEVKTRLDREEIEDAEEKRRSIRALSTPVDHPPLALVAYLSTRMLTTAARHFRRGVTNGPTDRVDLALVLDQAMIAGRREMLPRLLDAANPEADYVVGIAAALQTIENRERQVGRYRTPPVSNSSHRALIDNHLYTICATPLGEVLAESSRALLLFCEAMLSYLASRENGSSVFRDYIPAAGWDLLYLSE